MKSILLVASGGALGAVCRYALGLIPNRTGFPWITLLINFIGAFLIGCITGAAEENDAFTKDALLFLKIGVCGGFTTFSSFSLEALELLEKQSYAAGMAYAVTSVLLCVAGVLVGKIFSARLTHRLLP